MIKNPMLIKLKDFFTNEFVIMAIYFLSGSIICFSGLYIFEPDYYKNHMTDLIIGSLIMGGMLVQVTGLTRNKKIRSCPLSLIIFLPVMMIILLMMIGMRLIFSSMGSHGDDAYIRECESNMSRIGMAINKYADDHNGDFPSDLNLLTSEGNPEHKDYIEDLPGCPGHKDTFYTKLFGYKCPYDYGYKVCREEDTFILWCRQPESHAGLVAKEGYWPQYTCGGIYGSCGSTRRW